ncbi:histidine kinase [Chloroflexota bacterium]
MSAERIRELETKIAELKERMPRHSVPPHMLIELEDMEDELDKLKKAG